MTVGEGEAGQAEVLVGTPFRPGPGEERRAAVDHRRLVIEAHVERRLGAELEARVAEWLGAEAVALAGFAGVVAEQVDVVAVVRFVGGGGQHCQGRDSLAGLQADETPGGPRREVLEHQHLLWLEVRALRLVLPGKRLERQADLRVDPQRREERLTQVAGLALGSEAQGVRTRRVVADMRSGVGFLLVQQGGQSAALGGEERLQRLHLDFRRLADGRQLAQCQVAAHRMVGPGPQARRDDPRPQQQATQQQLHRLFALVSTRCRQAYQCGTPRALSCLDIGTLR
ncbi:hypothetical protein PAERUG_P6_East_of_England_6_IMP_1_03_09_02791 [Pseudomonas aeruginosa]|nr:hypothetical protein PAERUG_P6_East_of_England_6_IMP_1_03_09_02791 [Pseudomonas aeruginosa]